MAASAFGLAFRPMPPADTLTEGQFDTTGYGQFNGTPTRRELERFFFLDDADRQLVAKRRGDHNRLGFALQVVTARYAGTFLAPGSRETAPGRSSMPRPGGSGNARCCSRG
jgi:hypothetical protein